MRPRIPIAQPVFAGNESEYLAECLSSGWISAHGPFVGRFEDAFARLCEVPEAVACSNGTAALHLALLALGTQPGDEIVVPTLTYVATANAVRYCGATPVFADSEPATMNLDPADVESRITARTRGIVAVHLYGHPVDMDAINGIAAAHDLFVLEDAAEAHGARYRGRVAGSLAHAATFSFFANKLVTTGEGGMVTTADAETAARVRLLRGQGMDPRRRYWFPVVGFNYRMTSLQAAVGVAQLEKFGDKLAVHRKLACWYHERLAHVGPRLRLPVAMPWAEPANWMYTVVLRDGDACRRDEIMAKLDADGIETRPVFPPMHTLPPYRDGAASFPVAEHLAACGISLPTHGALDLDDVDYVCERLAQHLGPT